MNDYNNNQQPPYGQQPRQPYGNPQQRPPYGQQQSPYNQPGGGAPSVYIGFTDAIKICLNKYADFKGRATRAEYWWFFLFTFLAGAVVSWIPYVGEYLGGIVSLALIIPSLAVAWRRLHDMGKAGGWYFICLIPLVGIIMLIVWLCKASEPYDNRFGPYVHSM